MNSKRSEIFKIVNNKILNIVTGTFYEMNFDISDPYNNFITYNSTNDETLFVSNTVKKRLIILKYIGSFKQDL